MPTRPVQSTHRPSRRHLWWALPALAAVVMGLPTLRGGFVGGDDHRLALNHVLVNRPSLAHAVELFQITHRDLYQPVPLLSFSFDFLVVRALGLADRGAGAFAWYFHLVNVLLHAVNTILVGRMVRVLLRPSPSAPVAISGPLRSERSAGAAEAPGRRPSVENLAAGIASTLFAVHPFQTEVVAWTNGRMMLLSTLFGLLTLLSFSRWLDERASNPGRSLVACLPGALGIALLALLCAVSKIRIELPILMVIVVLARRARIDAQAVVTLAACSAITAVFVVVNVQATAEAELFSGGAEQLRGPRLARVMLALSFYFTHLVWPVGLASYYPTPPYVQWSDLETLAALVVVAAALGVMGWLAARRREWRLGLVWFFAAIAAVLPFFPARNVLAADRYMYFPIVGLFWPLAGEVAHFWMERLRGARRVKRAAVAVGMALVAVSILQCWNTARHYEDPVLKTLRIARLFPDVPRVWERLGWTYYEAGRYAEAGESAKQELRHDAPTVQSGAMQLLGMVALKTGCGEEALRLLHDALTVDPKSSLGKLRLAMAYEELGRMSEALPWYEAAAADAPSHNPTLQRLATVYRSLDRRADARRLLLQQVDNNPYEVPAILALAELDLEEGTPRSLDDAEARFRGLIQWMPENPAAHVGLGLVMAARHRRGDALEAYEEALAHDPNEPTALLNIAHLHRAAGEMDEAERFFDRAVAAGIRTVPQAESVHDFYASRGEWSRCAGLWADAARRWPASPDAAIYRTWSAALAGEAAPPGVAKSGSPLSSLDSAIAWCGLIRVRHSGVYASSGGSVVSPVDDAARAWCALATDDPGAARSAIRRLTRPDVPATLRSRLLRALERFDEMSPENPWTFCLAAPLLKTDGNLAGASAFLGLCERFCQDDACEEEVARLRGSAEPAKSSTGPRP